MRRLFIVFALCVCSLSFIACNDKEDKEEPFVKPAASVYYYLVGEERIDYTDIRIFELGSDYTTVDTKDVKIISGSNPVQFLAHKDCKSLVLVYKNNDEDGNFQYFRRYRIDEDEFEAEKDGVLLTLGDIISEEEYLDYFSED